jgi:hypothetical protein
MLFPQSTASLFCGNVLVRPSWPIIHRPCDRGLFPTQMVRIQSVTLELSRALYAVEARGQFWYLAILQSDWKNPAWKCSVYPPCTPVWRFGRFWLKAEHVFVLLIVCLAKIQA